MNDFLTKKQWRILFVVVVVLILVTVLWFWEWDLSRGDFLANLLSDLLAGAIIGSALAWWVGKKLSDEDRKQERIAEEKVKREKALQYLHILENEIEALVKRLPEKHKVFMSTGWGNEIRLETPFWDIVFQSGELPQLIHPNMVQAIAAFYHQMAIARRGRDWLIESWLVPHFRTVPGMEEKQKAFAQITSYALSHAINQGPGLLEYIRENIEALKEQVAALSGDNES